jgi:hypothetical protein
MKNSPLTSILLGALVLSAIVSIVIVYFFFGRDRELRTLSIQVNSINNRRAAVNALVQDVVEYSSHNHAIDPILEANAIKAKTGAAAPTTAPRPSGK